MAVSVQSGTLAMCMAMAPPERRESVPTFSGANPSLAAPALMVSAQRTTIMSEALAERSRWESE